MQRTARDLKNQYGSKLRTSEAVDAAIRAEMVGGEDLLDAIASVGRLYRRLHQRGLAGQREANAARGTLSELRDLMAEIVLER